MPTAKVILNPYAGRGKGAKIAPKVRQLLQEAGMEVDWSETSGPGHAIQLAREAKAASHDLILAAGGDGTVSEVVNGMAQATPDGETVGVLGVLPIGSGNDFADMAGCPRDLEAAVAAFRARTTRRVDLCRSTIETREGVLRRYFDNNLGMGFEAQVTVESYKITWLRGVAIYVLAVLRALRRYDQPFFHIRWVDEEGREQHVAQRSLMVSLGNSRRTGGGFYVTPDAVMDDGLLDMGIAAALSTPRILFLLPQVMMGLHRNSSAIRLVRCREVQVIASQPAPVHADGEVVTEAASRLEVLVEPRRLEVIVQA